MTTLAQISETQAQKATTANENFDAVSYAGLFGRRAAGVTGLTWAYYGGILYVAGVATAIADGTVALTASQTNYVEATTAGVVSANTVGFTAGRMPLYTVVTGVATITSYADQRARNLVGDFTAKGNVTIGGTLGVTGVATFTAQSVHSAGWIVAGGAFAASSNGHGFGYATAANGLVLYGQGSSTDFIVVNKSGQTVFEVLTGTQVLTMTAAEVIGSLTVAVGGTNGIGIGIAPPGASMLTIATTATSANHIQYKDTQTSGRIWQMGPGAGDASVTSFNLFDNTGGWIVAGFRTVAASTRYLTFSTSAGGNPAIGVNSGSVAIASDDLYVGLSGSGRAKLSSDGSSVYLQNSVSGSILYYINGAEVARNTSGGYFKASNTGAYQSSAGAWHESVSNADARVHGFTNTNATLSNVVPGVYIFYSAAAPNGTGSNFIYAEDSSALRFSVRSNGGIANFSANNVNLSSITVKRDRRRYTEAELDAFAVALERVDYGVWKYIDQTHDDFNHGPTAEGVRDAFAGVKGAAWAVPSLVDYFDEEKELLGLTPDLEQIAIATLIHSCKKLRGELAALKKTIH